MTEEDTQIGKDTSLRAAFNDSMDLATRYNTFVNRGFDKIYPDYLKSGPLDNFAIKSNAIGLTPFVWAARKFGLR